MPQRRWAAGFAVAAAIVAASRGDLVRMPDNRVTGSTSGWEPGRLAIAAPRRPPCAAGRILVG